MPDVKGHLDELASSVLDGDGDLPVDVRRSVEERSAELGGRAAGGSSVPDPLSDLVDKVALHAYKTTDSDIQALKHAGYSEDEILEVIVAAALGAGRARYERGMAALRGEI